MQRWQLAGVAALAIIVLSIPFYALRETRDDAVETPVVPQHAAFVGREQCVDCHQDAYDSWLGSHHDDAMDFANDDTVLGDFNDSTFEYRGVTSRFYRKDGKFFVHTQGAGGKMEEYEVLYTFGVEPLQQYLVPFPGGRLQALSTAWDTEQERWFFLYPDTEIEPDNWLHWSRNGQNWNGMCAECHSTNLLKNYDPDNDTYSTTWSEIDVSCEACHGPGSTHVDWAEIDPMGRPEIENFGLEVRTSNIDNREFVDLCMACHSRRSELGDYDHSQVDPLEYSVPSLLNEGLYHADGQILDEVYVWGSFVQSKMYANDVRCADCHDSHSLKLHQDGNALCAQCHQPDVYDQYEHHFHQKFVDGEPSDGALCVECHMPEQPYMVIDYRADHSLRVPRPDLSVELGVPNACSECHDDQTTEWAAEAYVQWYGKSRKPHYGTVFAAARNGEPGAEEGLHAIVEGALYPTIVRATALNALQGYPGERTNRAMRLALEDEEPLMRLTAVDAIMDPESDGLVERLGPMLFDPVRTVRIRAAARLAAVDRSYFKPYERDALDKELKEYIKATRRNLDFSAAGMSLANLYASQNNTSLAERYYRKALSVDDLFFPAKLNLAVLLSQQGEIEEPERLLREVLGDYPDQHDAAYSLALLLAGTSRLEEALVYLGQAADGLPDRSRIHYNHGLLLAQLSRDSDAEDAFNTALSLEPANLDYLYAIADFYMKRERVEDALQVAERMIASHPQQRIGYDIKAALEGRNN